MNERQRRKRYERRRHASTRGSGTVRMHLAPSLPPTASPQARLGLQIRNAAEVNFCCACGREVIWFRVLRRGPNPRVERIGGPEDDRYPHGVIVHEPSCPAASPEIERALKAAHLRRRHATSEP
jgi:hypothetical protein